MDCYFKTQGHTLKVNNSQKNTKCTRAHGVGYKCVSERGGGQDCIAQMVEGNYI